jgi:glycosyltransferase involved in cell wall biosynthesis
VVVLNLGLMEVLQSVWKNFYKKLDAYVMLFHNYRPGTKYKSAELKTIQRWVNKARLSLFASSKIIEHLERSGVKIQNSGILLNPISFEAPSHPSSFPQLHNGNYRFIMLAALDLSRKAQDNLVTALSSATWKARNWTLHFYGEGKDRKMLEELIAKNGLEQKVFLEGHSDNVKEILQHAHILLQITHMDAMPLAVVEAMAMARPVVASSVGDMPDWITEGVSGWISEDASCDQIDKTLERAWMQRQNWEAFGKEAFAVFSKKFPLSAESELLQKIEAVKK